jgi:hypothetical protein
VAGRQSPASFSVFYEARRRLSITLNALKSRIVAAGQSRTTLASGARPSGML